MSHEPPARPRRPKEETARMGDEIYERDIKPGWRPTTTASLSPST